MSNLKFSKQMSESIKLGVILAIAGGFMDAYSYMCRGKVFAKMCIRDSQNPGHSLDLNPIKIRKLLITTGVYFPSTAAKLFCCSSKGKRTFTLVT